MPSARSDSRAGSSLGVERQMLKSDTLLAAFLIDVGRIAWVKFQSNRAKF